jgi:methyl-accepting chemotaxis protein
MLDAAEQGKQSGDEIVQAAGRMSSFATELVHAMDEVSSVVEQNTSALKQCPPVQARSPSN